MNKSEIVIRSKTRHRFKKNRKTENWEYVRNLRTRQVLKWDKIRMLTWLRHKRLLFKVSIPSNEEFCKIVGDGGAYDTTGMRACSFLEYLHEKYLSESDEIFDRRKYGFEND